MRSFTMVLSLSAIFATFTVNAALPPLSQEMREQMSSDIVSGTVMSMDSTIVSRHSRGFLDEVFNVELLVASVGKGDLVPGQIIKLTYWRSFMRPRGWAGPGGQYGSMELGQNVRVYMRMNDHGVYSLLEPNGFDRE